MSTSIKICVLHGNGNLECGSTVHENNTPKFVEALKKKPENVDDFIEIFNSARYPRNFDYYHNGKKEKNKVDKKFFKFREAGLPLDYVSDDILNKETTPLGVVLFDLNNKKIIHLDNEGYWDFLDFMYIDIDRDYPPARKKFKECMIKEGKDPEEYPLYGTECYREAFWLEVKPPKDFKTRHIDFSTPEQRQDVLMELFECPERTSEFYRSVGNCL